MRSGALPGIGTAAWVKATAIGAAVAWAIGMLPSTFSGQLEDASVDLIVALASRWAWLRWL
jgi:hypothetical protein